MVKRIVIISLMLVLTVCKSQSQSALDSIYMLPDSAHAFTLENFYELIGRYHPLVKQVELMSDVAKQEIRLARGNFDPKIEASLLKKNFSNTEYYSILNSELKIPTVFPIDPKIGLDQNSGQYLNPERYISKDYNYQQLYAGISVPLGRGLITDDRRTALRQASLFAQSTEAEQIKMINKLLLDAAKDYWQWCYAYYNFRLYDRSVRIAADVFERTKMNCEMGELAPVDTIQAKITWQQRLIEQQEAWLDFKNSGVQVSNYLWDSLAQPVVLPLNWAPVDESSVVAPSASTVEELMQLSKENHPELQKVRIKLQHLEFDKKLAAENLKPKLNLQYNFLTTPLSLEENYNAFSTRNYKFGFDFSFPLLLRKERVKLASARLKISHTQYEERLTNLRIMNEIQSAYNTLVNNQRVLHQQISMADNYHALLTAELLNIENGESDLFKLNGQQEKLIQAQSKVLKLKAEVEKNKALLYWAAGVRKLQPNL